jgi:hypothetical protein
MIFARKSYVWFRLGLLLTVLGNSPAYGVWLHLKTSENQINLLELYTSEDCTICALPEGQLSSLRGRLSLWKTFIPIEFHTDYSDGSGWKDPFGQPEFSIRQREYGNQWGSAAVRVPQFVLNGFEFARSPTREDGINHLGPRVGILNVIQNDGNSFEVTFRPVSRNPQWIAHGALLANGLTSTITSGPNAGKTVSHDFVVIKMARQTMDRRDDRHWALIQFPDQISIPAKSLSVVFWVSQSSQLTPEQAVGSDFIKIKPSRRKSKKPVSPKALK